MTTEQDLLGIVGEIYEAVGSPDRWAICLASIRDLFQATAAHLLHHDHRSHDGGISVAAGLDPAAIKAYIEHYHRVDPWAASVKLDEVSVGDTLVGQAVLSHQAMTKTEYYAGLGKPYGLTRGLFGYLNAPSATRTSVLSVNRSDRAAEFGPEEVRLMQILVPHLQRALTLHLRLTDIDAQRGLPVDVLDRLSIGVMVVDSRLKITFVNRPADLMIRQQDGLTLDMGLLRGATATVTTRLNHAIALAIAVSKGQALSGGEAAVSLPRPSGRRAFQILVTPVSRSSEYTGTAGAAAIVFISDPEVRPQPDPESLCQYFGLTPSEARFAVAVSGGQTPQNVAETQRLTRASARWLTEQLRLKTASRTQAQAVAAILQSLAVLRRDRV